jgi:TRAP-type C4-dicarboxylate transport system permease small subunit
VRISGTITIACALPYTTAVKGHVAIEYFFHKLSRRGRIAVDTVARLAAITLFAFLARESFLLGESFRESGQVTQTVEIPEFWVPYVVAVSCAVVVLVIIHNLLRPGREMIRP